MSLETIIMCLNIINQFVTKKVDIFLLNNKDKIDYLVKLVMRNKNVIWFLLSCYSILYFIAVSYSIPNLITLLFEINLFKNQSLFSFLSNLPIINWLINLVEINLIQPFFQSPSLSAILNKDLNFSFFQSYSLSELFYGTARLGFIETYTVADLINGFMKGFMIYLMQPLLVSILIIEIFLSKYTKTGIYQIKETMVNLLLGLGHILVSIFSKIILLFILLWLYQFRLFEIENNWWSLIIAFVLTDLSFYCYHFIHHKSRFFWASHVSHHSSRNFNLSVAFRLPWTGLVMPHAIFWGWLALIGFHPIVILSLFGINLLYQFFLHTEMITKMPSLYEYVFNTPSHHRVHHSRDSAYLDKNFGGVFIIWDRLFGTFKAECEKPVYGITSKRESESLNPFYISLHEWLSIFKDLKWHQSISQNLNYVFNMPGWHHENQNTVLKSKKPLRKP